MVTRFIDGAQTMSPAAFKLNAGAPARAGEAFRKLHDSGAVFPFRFELFAMIDDYLKILSTKDVALPQGYHDVLRRGRGRPHGAVAHPAAAGRLPLRSAVRELSRYRRAHVDRRLGIFRHERSDVGSRRPVGGRQVRRERRKRRCCAPISAASRGRPSAAAWSSTRRCATCLWTLWGLIQLANDNPADDFRAYADGRFARCRKLMQSADFARHLEAVRKG